MNDNASVLERVDDVQKSSTIVGFTLAVVKKYLEDGGGRLAATVAYYAFFSVFPALLALVAITGFVLDDNPGLRADVVDTAVGQFPVIGETITENSLGGNTLALVIGLTGAIWAGLGAMLAIEHAMNTIWDVPWHDRPNPVMARLRGLLMFLVIGVGLVGATLSANLLGSLALPGVARVGIVFGNIGVNTGFALIAFRILTKRDLDWSDVLPGAVVAGLSLAAMQSLGGMFVRHYVSGASDTYGTFALVIGLLTWFHVLSQSLLIAAEVNVVRSRGLYPRTLFGDDLTDGDHRALQGFQQAAARHEAVEPRTAPVTSRATASAGSRSGS